MTIYKLNITVFDYWYTEDRSGWAEEEKYFTTKEKAENWVATHPRYAHDYDKNGCTNEAVDDYHLPKFEIKEIEVE